MGYSMSVVSTDVRGAVVALGGEVDLATAAGLGRDLHEVVISTSRDIVLDLSDLEFIDSAGLGALIDVLRRLHEQDRRLVLVVVGSHLQRMFKVTGLELGVSIAESREAAWHLIQSSRLIKARRPL